MTAVPRLGEGRARRAEFTSRAEAQAWLAEAARAIGALPRAQFAATFLRIESAYEQFPELEAALPRRALFRQLRAGAAGLPDAEALALLLLCAAAEPSDGASLAALFERAALAGGSAGALAVARLFRPYVALGWRELAPAVAALSAGGAGDAIPAILSEVLGGAGCPPRDAAELGRVLAPIAGGEGFAAAAPAALARAAAGARRALEAADLGPAPLPPVARQLGDAEEAPRERWMALAGRLKERLRPPPRLEAKAPAAWPIGEVGFASFLGQWPDLAIKVPACQLYTRYADLDADGVLRAERHAGAAFCYGPYLNLPAGRYRVRLLGEAGAGADYRVEAFRRPEEGGPVPVCERLYVREAPIAGAIAEFTFESDLELRDFEVVMRVTSPSAAVAVVALAITGEGLRPDLED